MLNEKFESMVNEIDAVNAQYIMNRPGYQDKIRLVNHFEAEGKTQIVDSIINEMKEKIAEFDGRFITPANAKVGDGVTMHLWSDAHAGTITKVTKTSVTVQRDHATLNPDFKPEVVPGGFVGHCTNQNEQSYTYERNESGTEYTFRWSNKFNRFQNTKTGMRLSKGRHEFYDYNF